MARLMGIDYGTKRIGLAIGDDDGTPASPIKMLQASGRVDDDVRAVLACAQEYAVDALVVGLPLNMDDTEGPQAKLTRVFGERLTRETGLTVHYRDERLSTFAAGQLLQPAALSRKKRKTRLDSISAQVILQDFLDARAAQRDGDR
ncbi:MAG: Holliday junction resolvase RuvX [Planctomycetes bacterium]|nr:Holliday junction resolvase RuvX [Planctomycetota bacterium]